jgi:hypothetical protein
MANVDRVMKVVVMALLSTTVACDDEASVGQNNSDGGDANNDEGGEADTGGPLPCIPEEPIGDTLYLEPQGVDSEFSDCIAGCVHDPLPSPFDLDSWNSDGVYGVIDGNAHEYTTVGVEDGPDTDFMALTVPPRSIVEIIVEPYEDSPLDPMVLTHDGFGEMTFNDNVAAGARVARTMVSSPSSLELPFFIFIMDIRNYDQQGVPNPEWVGGEDFGYTVRFRVLPFEPEELGTLDEAVGEIAVNDKRLDCAGDIHYYRFEAAGISRPSVDFERTGSETFNGLLVGMSSVGGDLYWEDQVSDEDGDGQVTLPRDSFEPCTGCSETPVEFIFAVTDYSGNAWPGDFTYNLTLTYGE